MDEIVAVSGVAKMTLYKHFTSKDLLIAEVLRRKDAAFSAWFVSRVEALGAGPVARLLACFDVVEEWTRDPAFRGCPFLNAAAEISRRDHPARGVVLDHKRRFLAMLKGLCVGAGADDAERLSRQWLLLIDGAAAECNVWDSAEPARRAKDAARVLLDG